jgi:hypothetical protein
VHRRAEPCSHRVRTSASYNPGVELIRASLGSQGSLTARLILLLLSFFPGISSGHVILKAPPAQKSGAVACESKVCSEVGIDLLKRGVGYLRFYLSSTD